jgi:maltose alpha-D-glucosyltransferase/alpha-amylase
MLNGDQRLLELTYSLLLTLPGTPVLRYGDEIGMGDDLSLPERMGVRTPMQWADEKNGGFSSAAGEDLIRPMVVAGDYGYDRINVAAQQRDSGSFVNWMERAIRVRKECPEFGWGKCQVLETGQPSVFAHRCEWKGGAVIACHNLGDQPAEARIDLNEQEGEHLVEVLGDHNYKRVESLVVKLGAYGCRWFRLGGRRWKLP